MNKTNRFKDTVATILLGFLLEFCYLPMAHSQYKVVVDSPMGGLTDVIGRHIFKRLPGSKYENVQSDAAGALEYFIGTPKDDHSFLLLRTDNLIAAMDTPTLLEMIQGTTIIGRASMAIVVGGSSPINDFNGLIVASKTKPIRFGMTGGLLDGMCAKQVTIAAGISAELVSYSNFGQAVDGLLTSKVDAACLPLFGSLLKTHLPGNKLKALAVTSTTQHGALPKVPTLEMLGIKGVVQNHWYILATHAGNSQGSMQPVVDAVRAMVEDAGGPFGQLGIEKPMLEDLGPEAADRFLRREIASMAALLSKTSR